MDELAPADFYTGIVVDVYSPLRGTVPESEIYERFIRSWGEPALELGCGDGDPLLELRAHGLDVEGLDSSPDMLAALGRKADASGISVTVHHSTIEAMDLGRTYRSIFLAGPTFNLLPDDAIASLALERIRAHLDPAGAALIPLFVPDPVPPSDIGVVREHVEPGGRVLRVSSTASHRDDEARRQITTLRYEVIDGTETTTVERDWLLHWYSPQQFRRLAEAAGLRVERMRDLAGGDPGPDSTMFSFVVRVAAT